MIDQSDVIQPSLVPQGVPSRAQNQTGTSHATALGVLDAEGTSNRSRLKRANNIELSPGVLYSGWYQEVDGKKVPHGKGTRITVQPSTLPSSSNSNPQFTEVRKLIARILTDTTEEGVFQNGEFLSGEKTLVGMRKMKGVFGIGGLLKEGEILYENGIACKVQNMLMIERKNPQTHIEEFGVFTVGMEYSHAKLVKGIRRTTLNGSVSEEEIKNGEPKLKAYEDTWNQFQRAWNIDEIYPSVVRLVDEERRGGFVGRYESSVEDIRQDLRLGKKEEAIESLRGLKRYLESFRVNRGETLLTYLEEYGYPRLQKYMEEIEEIR